MVGIEVAEQVFKPISVKVGRFADAISKTISPSGAPK
jgi:hypothetical protein